MNFCAIVPSYNPDEKLLKVIDALSTYPFVRIIVVNDGSADTQYFDKIKERCDILRHYKNLGKGRALKTALNYYLNTYSEQSDGVVMVDGDNQHLIGDIKKCLEELGKNPNNLVLGCRNFNLPQVPKRSKFGNKTTSWFFKAICGLEISDTQTGLRAMSNQHAKDFLDVAGERFEYETNMLLETKRLGISISEVEIRTIYIDDNRSSHFNPILDSIAIYKVLFSFVWASTASAIIDWGLFTLITLMLASGPNPHQTNPLSIFFATVTARIISALFNFFVNKNFVFRTKQDTGSTMGKYYLLCALQMLTSFVGVYGLTILMPSVAPQWLKIPVDFLLFLISFQIQREWVFKPQK